MLLLVLTLAPPIYVIVLWSRRNELIPLDRHMAYLPLAIWCTAFMVVERITWALFKGQPVWGPYGGDKSVANGLLESMLVLFLSGIYLLRFPLSRERSNEGSGRIAWLLFAVVAVSAVIVAAAVPPLPE